MRHFYTILDATMQVKCPACNTLLNIPDHLDGKMAKCPCGITLKTKRPPPAPNANKANSTLNVESKRTKVSIESGLIEELTENDFDTSALGASSRLDASVGKQKMTQGELMDASAELASKERVVRTDNSYKKFTLIALAIFFMCLTPVLAFNGYKSYRKSSNFYASWQKDNSEASLLSGSTGGSKVVGAEAQKPQKINFADEFREQNLEDLRIKFKNRVQSILDAELALEIEQRQSRGQSLPKNSTLDWLIQWPETLKVDKLLFTITDNDYIKCELIIAGQPLQFGLEGNFFVTGINGIQWKKSTDNAPFGAKKNTLFRQRLIEALVIKMQTPINQSDL